MSVFPIASHPALAGSGGNPIAIEPYNSSGDALAYVLKLRSHAKRRVCGRLGRSTQPKIRGWANYHRHVVSKRTFERVDYTLFSSLWRWARRRHPNKNSRWLKSKYFDRRGNRDWSFFGETCDDEGRPSKVWLYYAKSTPIKRHVKVKSEANPYDPTYETKLRDREAARMLETFRGTRTLRYLWHEQRGFCALCHTRITRITGWRLHYCRCDGWFERCYEPRSTSSRVP